MWKRVVGHEETHSVSDDGRVFFIRYGRELSCETTWNGYRRITIGPKHKKVHHLVALAFIGPKPSPAHVVNHKDGVKTNNHADNLEWVTRHENIAHASANGLITNTGKRGLTIEKAREIRQMAETMSNGAIAQAFGLSRQMIGQVVSGECWKERVNATEGPAQQVPLWPGEGRGSCPEIATLRRRSRA